jgi:hypothetical protein
MIDVAAAAGSSEPPLVVCEVCRARPRLEQKALRNRAMTRMLRASVARR